MCVLCRSVAGEPHWSESLDDRDELDGEWTQERAARRHHLRLADRRARVTLANRLLALRGARVQDWQATSYIVRSSRGGSAIVSDWAALWPAAERLTGGPIDPLDPDLLAALDRESRDGR
jgi:hypothetical protein